MSFMFYPFTLTIENFMPFRSIPFDSYLVVHQHSNFQVVLKSPDKVLNFLQTPASFLQYLYNLASFLQYFLQAWYFHYHYLEEVLSFSEVLQIEESKLNDTF